MDRNKDAGSDVSASKSSHENPPPAAAAAQSEADEFGLPIKHYFALERCATSAHRPSDGYGDATIDDQDSARASDTKQDTEGEAPESQPASESGESHDTGSVSDNAAFEDAQATPPSDSPVSTTSIADGQAPEASGGAISSDDAAGTEPPVISISSAEISPPSENMAKAPNIEEALPPPGPPSVGDDRSNVVHSRKSSTHSDHGISEFSHQQLSMPHEKKDDDDSGWQTMPSYARYDMYDDDDRLVAREHDEEGEKYTYVGLGGAGKGYTRVFMDEDAESATSMDENTQYLFKEASGTSMVGEEEARDAMAQMQATKDLLTEGQRIAYVGVVRLETAKLAKEAANVEATKKTKKEMSTAAEAVQMWGQKMMMRLYSHMDISEGEQVMIEQLAEHGVVPADLTTALHANSRVPNPMAKDNESSDDAATEVRSPPPSATEEKAAEPPPPYETATSSRVPEVQTPSHLPTTAKIDIDLRWTILCDLFLILVADSIYDARSRVLLERVGASLDTTWIDICRFEKRITDALEMQQAAEKENWNEEEHMEARRKLAKKKRYVMMGLATVGGGLVIGLSAGLLAPVIGAGLAAGFTTIGVTGTSGFLAGAGGAAVITSSAAASGSIIGGRAAHRRTGAVKTFEYRPLHNNKRANLIVTVSGWLTGKVDDVRLPFSTVDPIMGDIYSVLWEPEMLRSMGDTINILATEALTQGLQQILGSTILVSLMAALQLPIVLTKLSYLIDNPWAVSLDRANAAGLILADSLLERSLGTRPITLVGYSLGARVIFSCLQELARKGAYSLVQNVYMFGSPIVVKKEQYLRVRTVVSGRFVNGYNRNDWILGYLFRLTNGGIQRVAGLAAIDDCPWMENMDVTDLVSGHMEYRKAMPSLLIRCGWVMESEEFTEIEDPDPENHQERQRELINEIEEARKELEREGRSKKGGKFGFFSRRKKAERQEWEVYEDMGGKEGRKEGRKGEGEGGNNHGVLFDIDAIRAELAKEAQSGGWEGEVQVKEIKSTLPPMKLDMSPTSPAAHGRNPLRETKSADVVPVCSSDGTRMSQDPPAYEEIQMTFDTSFDGPYHKGDSTRYGEVAQPATRTLQTAPKMTVIDGWADTGDEDLGREQEISMTFA